MKFFSAQFWNLRLAGQAALAPFRTESMPANIAGGPIYTVGASRYIGLGAKQAGKTCLITNEVLKRKAVNAFLGYRVHRQTDNGFYRRRSTGYANCLADNEFVLNRALNSAVNLTLYDRLYPPPSKLGA